MSTSCSASCWGVTAWRGVLSTNFLDPEVPEVLQEVLGNGVFLVIAWVGLWYPLDLLFFARLPLRRERPALRVLARIPIEVRARG